MRLQALMQAHWALLQGWWEGETTWCSKSMNSSDPKREHSRVQLAPHTPSVSLSYLPLSLMTSFLFLFIHLAMFTFLLPVLSPFVTYFFFSPAYFLPFFFTFLSFFPLFLSFSYFCHFLPFIHLSYVFSFILSFLFIFVPVIMHLSILPF